MPQPTERVIYISSNFIKFCRIAYWINTCHSVVLRLTAAKRYELRISKYCICIFHHPSSGESRKIDKNKDLAAAAALVNSLCTWKAPGKHPQPECINRVNPKPLKRWSYVKQVLNWFFPWVIAMEMPAAENRKDIRGAACNQR